MVIVGEEIELQVRRGGRKKMMQDEEGHQVLQTSSNNIMVDNTF